MKWGEEVVRCQLLSLRGRGGGGVRVGGGVGGGGWGWGGCSHAPMLSIVQSQCVRGWGASRSMYRSLNTN